jgi:hypothetical protein
MSHGFLPLHGYRERTASPDTTVQVMDPANAPESPSLNANNPRMGLEPLTPIDDISLSPHSNYQSMTPSLYHGGFSISSDGTHDVRYTPGRQTPYETHQTPPSLDPAQQATFNNGLSGHHVVSVQNMSVGKLSTFGTIKSRLMSKATLI